MNADALRKWIRSVPDFPKPGILFRDITPLLQNPAALNASVGEIAAPFREQGVERVFGIESRGFLFGAPVALELGTGFGLIRKPGKLPGPVHQQRYALEYGEDAVEIQQDKELEGQRVLLVDDLLASGGTAAAAVALLRQSGAEVVACAFLIELCKLEGRARTGAPCHAVIRY